MTGVTIGILAAVFFVIGCFAVTKLLKIPRGKVSGCCTGGAEWKEKE